MKLEKNKELAPFTTFGIGGPARSFIAVKSVTEMQDALVWCHENHLSYLVLGKGSNTLFDDKGFDGCVILNKIDFIESDEEGLFHVGAGYNFSLLGTQTARKGWSGLEFASGIPGSVGGAIFMNAGANGIETCESLVSVDYIDDKGELYLLNKVDLDFSYRHSPFQHLKGAITGATFKLHRCDEARKKQIDIITYRKQTQPYGEKSAGCIFRNPQSGHAGALIETCGLKGTHIRDAKVSARHANFIVNTGHATAKDVLVLIETIQTKVKQSTGKELQSEVRYIPYSTRLT